MPEHDDHPARKQHYTPSRRLARFGCRRQEHPDLVARGRVPDPNGTVLPACGEQAFVGREGHRREGVVDRAVVDVDVGLVRLGGEAAYYLPTLGIPDIHRRIPEVRVRVVHGQKRAELLAVTRSGDVPATGREHDPIGVGHAAEPRVFAADELADLLPRLQPRLILLLLNLLRRLLGLLLGGTVLLLLCSPLLIGLSPLFLGKLYLLLLVRQT